jgi:hypothetical protein
LNGVVDRRMDHGKVEERRRPGWTSTGEDRIRRDHVQLGDWVRSRRRCPDQTSTNDEACESSEPGHSLPPFGVFPFCPHALNARNLVRDLAVIDQRRFISLDGTNGRIRSACTLLLLSGKDKRIAQQQSSLQTVPLRATAISGAAQGQASAPSPVPAYREKRRRGERRGRQIRAPLARRLRPSSRARSRRTVRRSKSPIGSTPTVSSSRRRASNGEQRGSNVALLLLTLAARRGSVPASPMKGR